MTRAIGPDNSNSAYRSATELCQALATGETTASALLEETISRIEQLDDKINAVVVRNFDQARAAAREADAKRRQGSQQPLLGLPMTVKESFNVLGLPTTWGNPEFRDWLPPKDSLVISRLKQAGAIIIGKTNVPLMLRDWQAFNEIYGTTNNPWDLSLTPGGSSGGSAAALAAGFVSLELGSDMGGSLRVPADFCGIYAHRPSQNLIPMRGSAPPTTPEIAKLIDLAVIGPMARSAKDLSLALSVLAGPDELLDGKGYRLHLPPPRHERLEDYRVLVIDHHPLCPISSPVRTALSDLVARLRATGVQVTHYDKSMPDLQSITYSYITHVAAQVSADKPAEVYENIRNTLATGTCDPADFETLIAEATIIPHHEWLMAGRQRTMLTKQWRELYQDYDVVLCPNMPTTAFAHTQAEYAKRFINIDGIIKPYNRQFVWPSIATLFGLPATAAPIGQSPEGLPIGMQIIGDYLEDYTTIKFAELLASKWGGFTPPALSF